MRLAATRAAESVPFVPKRFHVCESYEQALCLRRVCLAGLRRDCLNTSMSWIRWARFEPDPCMSLVPCMPLVAALNGRRPQPDFLSPA